MHITERFAGLVEAELADKPFAVVRVRGGFDVGFALADARWVSILAVNDVRDSITYNVRVNERAGKFSINDTLRRISWSAGVSGMVPRLGFSMSYQSGRVKYGRVIQLGVAPGGFEVAFSPEEERARIRVIGQELGLKPGLSRSVLIGLWTAGGVIGLCILGAAIALIIQAFLG
ncbi:hypothetical protein [Pseudoclavibacter sp. VKM Ac-2888]|uniref:hypothetical protein n=1 Tax=Pseudoclavibacter sp. VKM Ac-2888 TaxID=2783830 RepID=UPI00188CDB8E|nr:hypothetical protein [Pseudoclavibacter sp. VKM Ac-2888]MBF4549289.1 hypothetical protein [Pseudoclavibacter sp. VKM Ac-2888]